MTAKKNYRETLAQANAAYLRFRGVGTKGMTPEALLARYDAFLTQFTFFADPNKPAEEWIPRFVKSCKEKGLLSPKTKKTDMGSMFKVVANVRKQMTKLLDKMKL